VKGATVNTPTKATVATIAAAIVALTGYVAGCQGNGHSVATIPTPLGPAVVDLWWCEDGQCVAATTPDLTPDGVTILAHGVDFQPMYALPAAQAEHAKRDAAAPQ